MLYVQRAPYGRPRWQIIDRDTDMVLRTVGTFAEAESWVAHFAPTSRRR
jgi:hypothetical protein